MKLSIIIPYYNTKREYTDELLDILEPQMTDETECVLVDDGSKVPYKTEHKWVRVIYQKNGGTSVARNTGIDNTTGEYIAFIDSDDTVAPYFVEKILRRIDSEHFDYMEMSWRSMPDGPQFVQKLDSIEDHLTNPSVCHRVFKRTFIADFRFNPKKLSGEDEEFSRKIGYERGKRAVEPDFMCFYRTAVPDSKSKRFAAGEMPTRKIVYYIPHVTNNMTDLYEEVRREDEENQIYILADSCDEAIKEKLSRYCRFMIPPKPIRGHELRGKFTPYYIQIDMPVSYQVIIYASRLHEFGGLETFIYNFCRALHEKYDIMVLYEEAAFVQISRLSEFVKVSKWDPGKRYSCQTLVMNSILDEEPRNIKREQKIQMCHTCRIKNEWRVPDDNDKVIYPSETARKSFADNHTTSQVIPNSVIPIKEQEALILVTASRLCTVEKGKARMLALAKALNDKHVNYVWLVFSDCPIDGAPKEMIFMGQSRHAGAFIKSADYLVQLSDSESFCYSIIEAISSGVPVITTPLPVLEELGVRDKVNAHIVPFSMKDIDIDAIVNHRLKGFPHRYDNKEFVESWTQILGSEPAKKIYNPGKMVMVEVIRDYTDIALNERLIVGTKLLMPAHRAETVKAAGFIKIVGGGT